MKKLYFLFLVCPFLISCTAPEGHLSIVDSSDIGHLIFCITTKPNCQGNAVIGNIGYHFDEIDESGKFKKNVWAIYKNHKIDSVITKFQYGVVPAGWEQHNIAEPFVLGKYYRIGGAFVVTCKSINSKNSCKVIELQDFHEGVR